MRSGSSRRGALICALLAWRWARHHLTFAQCWLFCLLGYATHRLVDACSTYGTQLLWPFSDMRVAWNNVSIVDPLFTLPVVALVAAGSLLRRRWLGRLAFAWALAYLALGVVQRERAEAIGHSLAAGRGHSLAAGRGHVPVRLEAKPGFATLLLWKLVYEADGVFHVDAVHVGLRPLVFDGEHIAKLDRSRQLAWLDPDSQQARDVERFRWFSNDYLALDGRGAGRIIDIRYSMLPNRIEPLWAIFVEPGAAPDAHIRYATSRNASRDVFATFWTMLTDPVTAGARPL